VCHANYAGSALVTRLVVACLPALLLVQPREAWTKIVSAGSSKHPLPKAWQLLLASTGDGRPKVRKAAHTAVLQLCEGDCCEIASQAVGNHCSAVLRKCGKGSKSKGKQDHRQQIVAASGTLSFLQAAAAQLSAEIALPLVEPVIQICQMGEHTALSAIGTLHALATGRLAASLTPTQLTQLLQRIQGMTTAALDASSAASYSQLVVAVTCQAQSAVAAAADDTGSNAEAFDFMKQAIPAVWESVQLNLQSDCDEKTVRAATEALEQLLEHCVVADDSVATRVVQLAGGLLRYKYKAWWAETMPLLSKLLYRVASTSSSSSAAAPVEVTELVQSVAALCNSTDAAGVDGSQLKVLRAVLGAAVSTLGPSQFLDLVPISTDIANYQQTAWLIGVLRSHVHRAQLRFFSERVLPMAHNFARLAGSSVAAQDKTRLAQLHDALWGLLVPLCSTRPTDVATSFRGVAKSLGDGLMQKELRVNICVSLTALIRNSQRDAAAAAAGATAAEAQGNLVEVAKFAKNFLPLLFNVFGEATGGGESDAVSLVVYIGSTGCPFVVHWLSYLFASRALRLSALLGRTPQWPK
jgi:ribosomal RNA-processing protein 12